ncbi:MAG: tRNA pseudouridine(38-40) synthase TruA [Caldisericia bacterium]|nr:tRNA pseudouridine(38-40) synthase TruA [Caldisericia bacterium]
MRPFNYKAIISYDGTDFFGFQRQYGLPSIQVAFEDAIWEGLDIKTAVYGSSRTDRGVHALGQVVSFSIDQDIHPAGMKSMIAGNLPPSIRLRSLERAPWGFIARFAQRTKVYSYVLHNADSDSPFVHRGSWVLAKKKIDPEILEDTFLRFKGKYNFVCFGKTTKEGKEKDPNCTILEVDVMKKGDFISLVLRGDRFLHNMVRRIVGYSVECALGRENPDSLESIFAGNMRPSAGQKAPPQGLYLVSVDYE